MRNVVQRKTGYLVFEEFIYALLEPQIEVTLTTTECRYVSLA